MFVSAPCLRLELSGCSTQIKAWAGGKGESDHTHGPIAVVVAFFEDLVALEAFLVVGKKNA